MCPLIAQPDHDNHPYKRALAIGQLLQQAIQVTDADLTTELRYLWAQMRLEDLTGDERDEALDSPAKQYISACGHGNARAVLALKDLVPTHVLIDGFRCALTRDMEGVIEALLTTMSNSTLQAVVASYRLDDLEQLLDWEDARKIRDELYCRFESGRFVSIADIRRKKQRQCYERACQMMADRESAEISEAVGMDLRTIQVTPKKRRI